VETARTIIDRVLARLEDPDQRFFSTSDLVGAYNDALDELAETTEVHESSVVLKRRKWAAYHDLRGVLPPDALRVRAVWDIVSCKWVAPTTPRELGDTVGRQWEWKPDVSSRWWWMRGLYFLGAYPVPGDDVSSLKVYYSSLLPHVEEEGGLVTGLDSRTGDIPPDFEDAIEHYMMYTLLAQRKESQKSLQFWNRYQEHENLLADVSKNRMRSDRTPHMGSRRDMHHIGMRR
jgi:hypothetical protein